MTTSADWTTSMSFPEMRHWFLSHWDPDNPAYYNPLALRLRGPLHLVALQASLDELVRRHETLRTRFPLVDGVPVRVVDDPTSVPIVIDDFSEVPAEEREARLARQVSARASERFRLDTGPLFRASLIRCSPTDQVLLLASHHVVADGWSVGILCQELEVLYAHFRDGADSPPPLPGPTRRYSDFAREQAARLDHGAFQDDLDFWRSRLQDVPPLDLPADRPRAAAGSRGGGARYFDIPADVYGPITELARSSRVTPFMVFLSAFNALLARLSGESDVTVGSPVAGRPKSEFHDVVGCFVNMVVFRTDLSGDPTFRDLVTRVRATAVEAYRHQEVPFEKLVFELQPTRDPTRYPFFEAILTMQPKILRAPMLPGLEVSDFRFEHVMTVVDVSLTIEVIGDRAEGTLTFDAGLFDEVTVDRLIERFLLLVRAAVADPDRPISTLPILTDDERAELAQRERAVADYPAARCIHELFAEQVAATPDAEAVVDATGRLTYAELGARATSLAGRLRARGVGPDTVVGVLIPRSLDAVVAVLAVLEAGGAYLPLDPRQPSRRLGFMLEDAAVAVVVSRSDVLEVVADLPPVATVLVDQAEPGRPSPATRPPPVHPDNLAYVIYTSGSTGAPKGVAVTHRGVTRLVFGQRYARFGPDRRSLVAHLSFDASTFEIWSVLLHGGTAVVLEQDLPTPADLRDVIRRHRVTTVLLVTSLFNLVVDEDASAFEGVDEALVGGEALSVRHVRAAQAALPDVDFVNVYGPTECTTFTTCHRIERPLPDQPSIPIGPPVSNTVVRILDPLGRPVPPGAPGEIHVGGPGCARGYLHRPGLTAERFVPDPMATEPGARLYRTGDLGRWLPDGTVEFLGRLDSQMKVRGYRIEPGEIEAALAAHPAVREAVVVQRQDRGRQKLVAYVVPRPDALVVPTGLREHLLERVPDYMVPQAFTVIDRIPLRANGKLDAAALPDPEPVTGLDIAYEEPSSDTERVLADIWARVLVVERVGIWDNFFALGGDSILAVQVAFLATEAGIAILPRDLFDHQTVAELAAAADVVAGAASAAHALEPGTLVPLTPVQRWFFGLPLANRNHFNQALLFESDEPVDADALDQALRVVVARHDAFRVRFHHDGEGWRQAYGDQVLLDPTPVVAVASDADLEAALGRLHRSLDIEAGRLLAAAVVRSPGQSDRVALVAHHLCIDALSWQVVLPEVERAYRAARRRRVAALAPATTTFGRWAAYLEGLARSGELLPQLPFWAKQRPGDAAGAGPEGKGPGEGTGTAGSTRLLTTVLDAEETDVLLRGVRPALGASMEEVLLMALATGVQSRTGAQQVALDVESHGRDARPDAPDVSRTVGWFTALYPVVLRVPSEADPRARLAAVADQVRAVPERGFGYGVLRYMAGPGAETLHGRRHADIRFNYLGWFDRVLPGRGLFARFLGAPGPAVDPASCRSHAVEVDVAVVDGCLRVSWTYGGDRYRDETVAGMSAHLVSVLREVVDEIRSQRGRRPRVEDFPAAGIDQERLDALMARLGGEEPS